MGRVSKNVYKNRRNQMKRGTLEKKEVVPDTMPVKVLVRKWISPTTGYGIFAKVDIKKHTCLGFYDGQILTNFGSDVVVKVPNCSITQDLKQGDYVVVIPGYLAVDAEDPGKQKTSWGRYINGTSKKAEANVEYRIRHGHYRDSTLTKRIALVASKRIKAGQELIAFYGSRYCWVTALKRIYI